MHHRRSGAANGLSALSQSGHLPSVAVSLRLVDRSLADGAGEPFEWISASDGVAAAAIDCVWDHAVHRRIEGQADLRCKVQLEGRSHYSYRGAHAGPSAGPQIMFLYKPAGLIKEEQIEAGVHERSVTLVFPVDQSGVAGCSRADPGVDRAMRLMEAGVVARQGAVSSFIAGVVHSILDSDRGGRNSEKLRRIRVDELACLTLDLFLDSLTELRPADLTARERRQILEAREVLMANLSAPPSLNRLAATVGTNRTKLNRGFRSVFGASPYQFLHRERMNLAHALLKTDELTVTEIAARCGYDHVSNFSLAFKAHFGQPPSSVKQRA